MGTTTATGQHRKTVRKNTEARVIRCELKDRLGNPRSITADVIDVSEIGIGISLLTPLESGLQILIRGSLGQAKSGSEFRAEVKWCVERPDGTFRAGLEFLKKAARPAETARMASDLMETDWYDVMQLSPHAEADTISRVYRILAQRYHPDNPATGSAEMFMRLAEAHRLLSDPEQRAKYDTRHRESKQLNWKIFDQAASTTGRDAERRKRRGILELLYAKTLHDPDHAGMTVLEFEQLLGCPREHLQAALWYLKAKRFVVYTDNSRFSITVQGFDEAEGNPDSAVNHPHKEIDSPSA